MYDLRFYKYRNLPVPTSPYPTLCYQHNLWVPCIHHRMAINFMLFYSVTTVATGQFASWAHHPTQLQSARRGRCLARLSTARRYFSPPQNTDTGVCTFRASGTVDIVGMGTKHMAVCVQCFRPLTSLPP